MQVILLEKVINLGSLGDIVKVKDGYARNFLIPQGHAKRATAAAKAEFAAKRKELEQIAAEKLAKAQEIAEKLTGLVVKIAQKAGVDGRLFGSVTNADIAKELHNLNFEVPKSHIKVTSGAIKTIGDFTASINLHTDVTAEITVAVIPEAE